VSEVATNITLEEAIAEADRFLYIAKAQGRNCVVSSKDNSAPQPRTILLAEGDDTIATIIKSRLGREGFNIKHFTDGPAALEAAKSGGYSLCILDAKLPVLDLAWERKGYRPRVSTWGGRLSGHAFLPLGYVGAGSQYFA
jgi:PleD family two-component response regulator